MRRFGLLLSLIFAAGGCGSLDHGLAGRLPAPELAATCAATFTFDELGNATLNGQPLRLPTARENERYGVTVVDLSALPPAWRPDDAPEGGFMVAALEKASPLAAAGLQPTDLVYAVDGARPASVQDLIRALREAPLDRPVKLAIGRKGDVAIEVEAAGGVRDSTHVYVPFLAEGRGAANGSSLGLGPWDGLFWYQSTLADHRTTDEGTVGYSRGVLGLHETSSTEGGLCEHFEWGMLFNLVTYEADTPAPRRAGTRKARLRIFWLFHIEV